MPRIVAGSNTMKLAEKVSAISGLKIARKTIKRFPDGETYVRMEDNDFKGENVFIIHSLFPEQNESLVELMLTINAVKESKGKPVAVIPYLAYARQDRVFKPGEAFSLKVVAGVLKSAGTEKLITIDAHFHRKAGDFDLFGLPARNITAVKLLRNQFGKDMVVVGPDEGSKDFLSSLDGVVLLRKRKDFVERKDNRVHYKIGIEVPEIRGENVLLLDDIVSSGGTTIVSAKALKDSGKKVNVACTHGLFIGESLKELGKYTEKIICTDTVESECSTVSVAGLIADNLS